MTDTTVTSGTQETVTTQPPVSEVTTTEAPTTVTTTEAPVTPSWRNDWREALAKGDQKTLERLARFPSVDAVWDSFREAEKKISTYKPSPVLPDNATEAQVTEYRKALGIPETPQGYLEALPEGLVIGEADKPAMELLASELHGLNVKPEVVGKVVETYYKMIEQNHNEMIEAQIELKKTSGDELRAEWGQDYRSTINSIAATLDGLDAETRELVENMQLGNGALAFNHPGFMRWMGSLATQINPAAIVVPGGSGDKAQSVDAEIKSNLEFMSKDINGWQHASNASRRARHYQLLEAQEKFKARA